MNNTQHILFFRFAFVMPLYAVASAAIMPSLLPPCHYAVILSPEQHAIHDCACRQRRYVAVERTLAHVFFDDMLSLLPPLMPP